MSVTTVITIVSGESSTIQVANPPALNVSVPTVQPANIQVNAIGVIGGGSVNVVVGETPTGLINGSNATFITEFNFNPDWVEIFVNGIRQRDAHDYVLVGINQFNLMVSPLSGDAILINYKKV